MSQAMTAASPDSLMTLDEIVDNFSLLEEWDDRYRYVIELGRGLSPLAERDRIEANKVQGCASQVWPREWTVMVVWSPSASKETRT
jgi:sulfur transfer protein SufE